MSTAWVNSDERQQAYSRTRPGALEYPQKADYIRAPA